MAPQGSAEPGSSGFGDDDGSRSPLVTQALEDYAAGAAPSVLLAAVSRTRVLVPVVAAKVDPGQPAAGSPTSPSSPEGAVDVGGVGDVGAGSDVGDVAEAVTEMSAVLMEGRDGRRALLAFTSVEAMQSWDPHARPVPLTSGQAARAARAEPAEALLVDIAGPVPVVVEGDDLVSLADGLVLVRVPDGHAWAVVSSPDSS